MSHHRFASLTRPTTFPNSRTHGNKSPTGTAREPILVACHTFTRAT